jgi:hypothetical protein
MTDPTLPPIDPSKLQPLPPAPPPLRPGDMTQPVELRDFMVGVGQLLDLPPKRPTTTSMPTVPARAANARPPLRQFFLPATALLLAAAVVLPAVFPSTASAPVVPTEVMGEWSTKFSGYDGRRMRITPTVVEFVVSADGRAERYPIVSVAKGAKGDSTIIELSYGEGSDPLPMRLAMARSQPGKVAIARPEGLVWERVGRSSM